MSDDKATVAHASGSFEIRPLFTFRLRGRFGLGEVDDLPVVGLDMGGADLLNRLAVLCPTRLDFVAVFLTCRQLRRNKLALRASLRGLGTVKPQFGILRDNYQYMSHVVLGRRRRFGLRR